MYTDRNQVVCCIRVTNRCEENVNVAKLQQMWKVIETPKLILQ